MKNYIPLFNEFLTESFHMPDGTPIGVDKNHQPVANEGYMSELDLIRQESSSLQDFIKKAKAEFPKIAKMKDADEFLKEIWNVSASMNENINDPILMAIRASKDDRKKAVAAQKERMKKRIYGKKREALEDQLWDISRDLKDAYAERRNIYDDMEAEAGEKGNDWSDDDANRYGSRLNLVDDEIETLLQRRQTIELKLSY
jgi:hypothetical protein